MKSIITFSLVFSSLCLAFTGISQETTRKITVSGESIHNLSPNEIVLKIAYQEYFNDTEETKEEKVRIEEIEKTVLSALKKAGVKSDDVTMGGVSIVRPYKNGIYQKRRLNKSLYVCVKNTEEYICVTRHLEKENLFDDIITEFTIAEFKHTEKEAYLTKSRSLAYENAKEKAMLILSKSGKSLGSVININEIGQYNPGNARSLYAVESDAAISVSGFKPIVVSYKLEITFEIID